jgi:hypothetical protein
MKCPVPAVPGIAALVLWAGPAGAAVTVNFANPERYADAKLNGVAVLPALKAYFQQLGARHLGRGQDLKITVLDVDLAGREAPERGLSFPRILSGVTWPKIKVSYVLSQNRKVIESREELISDQFYQAQPGGRSSGDPLFYEKAMLDDWFRGRFGRQR